MRISARVAGLLQVFTSFLLPIGLGILFLTLAAPSYAQTDTTGSQRQASVYEQFRTPDVDADVPRNSHAFTQIVLIDVLSAVICQISGIDPLTPSQPCLDLNPKTGKLGIAGSAAQNQFGQAAQPQVGGALGAMSGQIALLYTPTISSVTYFNYLSENFGIVKKAYAQATPICNNLSTSSFGYGYCGLYPIFEIWKVARDMAYAFLVIAFVVLALGIMLRFRVDPRTVMTLSNQIPRVVIAIILITFSYAIAGIMIDIMWTVTYMGVNAITRNSPVTAIADCDNSTTPKPIKEVATGQLLETPLSYVNSIFNVECGLLNGRTGGVGRVANITGNAVSTVINNLVLSFIGIDFAQAKDLCTLLAPVTCLPAAVGFIITLAIKLIMLITLLIALIRLWFELLKTAVLFLIYVIGGPLWIVFGLVPGRPLGFEKWIRQIFTHLAIFCVVVFMLVFAVVLANVFPAKPDPSTIFIPPLIGNPNIAGLGILLAFGLILITPSIPNLMKEKMGVPPGKLGPQARATIGGGAAVVAATTGAPLKPLLRKYDPHTGRPAGVLRDWVAGRVAGYQATGVDKDGKTTYTVKRRAPKIFRRFLYGATPFDKK